MGGGGGGGGDEGKHTFVIFVGKGVVAACVVAVARTHRAFARAQRLQAVGKKPNPSPPG